MPGIFIFLPETCLISIPADLKGKENEETVSRKSRTGKPY
jgi:hypothetical protein